MPFVFATKVSTSTLQAAGTVASWFGALASYKGASFPTSLDTVPDGNAVVFATKDEKPAGITLPDITGPTVAVIANPNNADAKLLLVMGRDAKELAAAADTLTLGAQALSGQTQVVGDPDIPAHKPYDARRWVSIDRPVKFGELVQPTDLQGNGLVPGLLTLQFPHRAGSFRVGQYGYPARHPATATRREPG